MKIFGLGIKLLTVYFQTFKISSHHNFFPPKIESLLVWSWGWWVGVGVAHIFDIPLPATFRLHIQYSVTFDHIPYLAFFFQWGCYICKNFLKQDFIFAMFWKRDSKTCKFLQRWSKPSRFWPKNSFQLIKQVMSEKVSLDFFFILANIVHIPYPRYLSISFSCPISCSFIYPYIPYPVKRVPPPPPHWIQSAANHIFLTVQIVFCVLLQHNFDNLQ